MEFVEGGLYWHVCLGFVECIRKVDDIAVFHTLERKADGTYIRMVGLDGDKDYEQAVQAQIDSHVENSQERLDHYKAKVIEEETYIGKLLYGAWTNMETKEEM